MNFEQYPTYYPLHEVASPSVANPAITSPYRRSQWLPRHSVSTRYQSYRYRSALAQHLKSTTSTTERRKQRAHGCSSMTRGYFGDLHKNCNTHKAAFSATLDRRQRLARRLWALASEIPVVVMESDHPQADETPLPQANTTTLPSEPYLEQIINYTVGEEDRTYNTLNSPPTHKSSATSQFCCSSTVATRIYRRGHPYSQAGRTRTRLGALIKTARATPPTQLELEVPCIDTQVKVQPSVHATFCSTSSAFGVYRDNTGPIKKSEHAPATVVARSSTSEEGASETIILDLADLLDNVILASESHRLLHPTEPVELSVAGGSGPPSPDVSPPGSPVPLFTRVTEGLVNAFLDSIALPESNQISDPCAHPPSDAFDNQPPSSPPTLSSSQGGSDDQVHTPASFQRTQCDAYDDTDAESDEAERVGHREDESEDETPSASSHRFGSGIYKHSRIWS